MNVLRERSDPSAETRRPIVSVCVLVWNHLRYVRRTLESVLAQADDVIIEIIVGDDCSDDGSSEIVAAFAAAHPGLLVHVRHQQRLGGSENYLDTLSRARGRYIAHLDGDDYWLPGKLRRQVEFLEAHCDCAAVYTNALTITETGDAIGLFNDAPPRPVDLACLLRRGNFFNTSSMMFRSELRQAILDLGAPLLDYTIHLRLAQAGFLMQLEEPLVAYRVNSSSSILAQRNDEVRALYWDAILRIPRALVTDRDFAMGVADFLCRVTLRSIRCRRLDLLRAWAPRVFTASPFGRVRTTLLVGRSVTTTLAVRVIAFLWRGLDRRRKKILYRY